MLETKISRGAFFYAKTRRRDVININNELRSQTESIITSVREIVLAKKVPTAEYAAKCRNCSLQNICQPKAMNKRKLKKYIKGLYIT